MRLGPAAVRAGDLLCLSALYAADDNGAIAAAVRSEGLRYLGAPVAQQMRAILDVIFVVLNAYQWIIIAAAVMSWLIAFNVVNMHNELARSIWNFLVAVTEPLLRPIRGMLPRMGTVDLSPFDPGRLPRVAQSRRS